MTCLRMILPFWIFLFSTDAAGIYYLKLDMVEEGVTWFELKGPSQIFHKIHVTP